MGIRESILATKDRATEVVDVSDVWPEVGKVRISVMSGDDRDSYEWAMRNVLDNKRGTVTAILLVRCIVDEHNQRLFQDDETAVIGAKSWKVLDRLWEVARRLNKLRDEDTKELEKNSAARGDASLATSAGILAEQNANCSPQLTVTS